MRARGLVVLVGLASFLLLPRPSRADAPGEKRVLDTVPTGTHWYAMRGGDGAPVGFARLDVARREDHGIAVQWELALAFDDGDYRESRSMAIDGGERLVSSEYRTYGNLVASLERTEAGFVVKAVEKGEVQGHDVEAPGPGTMTGLGFVLASAVPHEDGGRLARTELDEANALRVIGEAVFTWEGTAARTFDARPVTVGRVRLAKANGKTLPLEVLPDGRVFSVDWGGGLTMQLFRDPDEGPLPSPCACDRGGLGRGRGS